MAEMCPCGLPVVRLLMQPPPAWRYEAVKVAVAAAELTR